MSDLPDGWAEAPIGDVLARLDDGRFVHQGWSPQCERRPSEDESEWGVLKTTAVQAGEYRAFENKALPEGLNPKTVIEVRAGDLLLTCAGPRVRCGVACLVRATRSKLMISGKIYRFRADTRFIEPRFLEAALCGPQLVAAIDSIKTGGSESGLNLTHQRFMGVRIAVAPLAEQQRIVTAIEEAFSKLDTGEAALRTTRQRLKRLRESVLAAAVTGRLVPQTGLAADVTRTPGVGAPNDTGEALPATWRRSVLSEIADVRLGRQRSPERAVGPRMRPYLRAANVTWGGLALSDVKEMSFTEAESAVHELRVGDLLLSEASGSPGEVGKPAQFRGEVSECCIQNTLLRVRLNEACEPDFYEHFFRNEALVGNFARSSRGVGIHHLGAKALAAWVVPVPPLEEQRSIVVEIERQFSFIDACERTVDVGLVRCTALRRSILKSAFEGRLVPQDPTDEPASVLLGRIRADRDAVSKVPEPHRTSIPHQTAPTAGPLTDRNRPWQE